MNQSELFKINSSKKKIKNKTFLNKLNTLKKKIKDNKINSSISYYNQIKNNYSLSLGQEQKLESLYNAIPVVDFKEFKNNFFINKIELQDIPNYYGCYFQIVGIVSKIVNDDGITFFNLSVIDKNNDVEKTVEIYVEKEIILNQKKINVLAQLKGFSKIKKKMIFKAIIIYN